MRQPRTREGMIQYLAKVRCEHTGLPWYRTRTEYANCPKWKEAIAKEAKKIRKDARENKDSNIIRLINRLPKYKQHSHSVNA